ncbi:uncharacterized protein LOC134253245 [Saccostrea cucullata]|uniref:uncharacterized protein LOC134253245 n=1 Tax=Saccostrea cuccullata TaxID=36930 RepID=UPI002ED47154
MVDKNGNVVNFYVLPSATKNPKLRRQWINAVRRKNFKPSNTDHWHAVCSRHFVDGRPTDTNPIPTLFEYNNYMHDQAQGQGKRKTLTSKYNSTSSSQGNESHSEGKKQRTSQTSVFVQPVPVAELYQGIQHEIIIPDKEGGKVPITTDTPYSLPGIMQHDHPYVASPVSGSSHLSDTDWADADTQITNLEHENRHLKVHCEQLEERVVAFQEENTQLKNQLNESERQRKEVESKLQNKDKLFREILIDKLTKCDNHVRLFLGLPSLLFLKGLFDILNGAASSMKYWTRRSSSHEKKWHSENLRRPGKQRKLQLFEEFILALLRLRLGLNTMFCSVLFGVSQSTVSSIFTTWMCFLDQQLKPLLKWPSRQKIKKHMPLSFRLKYPNTRVIIDATEIFVQRPRNPSAQSRTWSNYKNKNTFKALVGISPNGAFTFISELWSGNISDRSITLRSGFLDLIQRGDHVMADRGFLINDLLLQRGAQLNMPPFCRPCQYGKGKYLTSKQIKESKNIASLRIHVERAIQRLKSYKFFDDLLIKSLYEGQIFFISVP